ncbi:hypothetical protein HRR77_009604 [Exophiala dermatitidis]|nr:hypothetical protein HRR77_009604 [Exophiala dermatitidis]KAJ4565268.1 hypothetical protein HRR79_009815 [Exophiala dermatitidis]
MAAHLPTPETNYTAYPISPIQQTFFLSGGTRTETMFARISSIRSLYTTTHLTMPYRVVEHTALTTRPCAARLTSSPSYLVLVFTSACENRQHLGRKTSCGDSPRSDDYREHTQIHFYGTKVGVRTIHGLNMDIIQHDGDPVWGLHLLVYNCPFLPKRGFHCSVREMNRDRRENSLTRNTVTILACMMPRDCC